jgi:hypothetical protein
MTDLLSRAHPCISVCARRDEFLFTGATEFRAAPVIWFNERGQVAAVGQGHWSADRVLQRVDLLNHEGCLRLPDGEQSPAVLFLRYAFVLVRPSRWALAPRVIFVDAMASAADTSAATQRRLEAFRQAATRAGAWRVESCASPAA